MSKGRIFFGGVPTEMEVKKLRDRWPETAMKVGDKFYYPELEQLLSIDRATHRFKTVTDVWRKLVENQTGIIIGCEEGEAFKVLSDKEKLELSRSKLHTSARMARRSIIVLARTDRRQLSGVEQAAYDHQQHIGAAIIASAQLRSKTQMLPTCS